MSEKPNSSVVCVDASVVIDFLIPGPFSASALTMLRNWQSGRVAIIAPLLLAYEVTSVLRSAVYRERIGTERGDEAFAQFRQLPIRYLSRDEVVPVAWQMSKSLNRSRAYDTTYLAVARLNGCDFWTADKRLYNAVSSSLGWVRWIEEAPAAG